jgi:hypothetical protein
MVALIHIRAGLLERVCRMSPFADGGLTCEHPSSNAGAGKSSKLGRKVLTTALLRVGHFFHVVVEFACSDRLIAVLFPPSLKQVHVSCRNPSRSLASLTRSAGS